MSVDASGQLISERILQRLKETLQAQSGLPQNDLSIQLSSMEASTSTLSEVNNILDGLDKKTLRNVAEQLASTDAHFVLQRYLIKCYYFVKSDGSAASLADDGNLEETRPCGVLIFNPLYMTLMKMMISLLVSPMFASNIASTKVIQLVLRDLNVLVLPSPEHNQFKMLLGNIHFLWELSKNPVSLAAFRGFSDTILILVNVFTSYQGPFEELTTLVKSLAVIIAGEVVDEETSIYLLAEETCLDFLVEILTKSVCAGEKHLNYHGVFAIDIAKCIENLSQFAGLREALLEKGVAQLLVSMIQIGDHYDDSAAARALDKLLTTYGSVDEPVLLQGLVSDQGPYPGISGEDTGVTKKSLSASKQESKEEENREKYDLKEVQNNGPEDNKQDIGHMNVKTERKTNAGNKNETTVEAMTSTITTESKPSKIEVSSKMEECQTTFSANRPRIEATGDYQKGKGTESREDDIEQIVVSISESENCPGIDCGKGELRQDSEILCSNMEEVKEMGNQAMKKLPQVQSALSAVDNEDASNQDVAAYIQKQLENLSEEGIKYIQIPTAIRSDESTQSESVCKEPNLTRSFQYQQEGTDHLSGQELHKIHNSLIELGVHNMYDEKLVSLLDDILEEAKLKEDGVFDILDCVPHIYSYKMLRTGSMQRQLRVVPAYNDPELNVPFIPVQPEIDYHLVLKKFIFQVVPDHGSRMSFPGFTFIGPWCERIPAELEEWSSCFEPQTLGDGMTQFYLSAKRLKSNFVWPMLLFFASMNIRYQSLVAKGENLELENLKRHGITVRKIEENGPAVTVYYLKKYLTIDYVLSLRQIQWPSCASSWQVRQRQWPDFETVKDIVSYGCHIVPKQPPTLSQNDPLFGMFFQYSFARAENVLLNKLNEDNPVLTDCLRMLKFLCELHFDRPKLLKSYHMQTIVLLAAERLPLSYWKANNFVKHLLDLLDDLLHYLVTHNLPNYFIPQQNLFEQFSADFIWDVASRVSKVRRNPIKYLTPSHDPARFGLYLL